MPDIFVSKHKTISSKTEHSEKTHPESTNLTEKKIEQLVTSELKPESSEKHMGVFSAYCVDPAGVSFADQEKDEKILLFLRRHFITNLDWIIIAILLSLVPLIFSVVNLFTSVDFNVFSLLNIPARFITFFLIFYYSAIFTFILVNSVSWFYNIGLITTKRVVDIDLVELVFKNIATTQHSLIQDVSYSQNGAIRSLFHFGDVIVQTAGQEGKFELEAVPHPDKVVHLIEDFIGKRHKNEH
ncbi:MAG: PH domain-containing protein [Patescibacteria group bacterium]